MTLVEQGKVKLDDPITKHMPFSERVAVGGKGASRLLGRLRRVH
jgi:CubicO group peptidase (beta-lactamase class C family)